MKRTLLLGLAAAWLGCSTSPTGGDGGTDASTPDVTSVDASADAGADVAPTFDASGMLTGPSAFAAAHVLMASKLPTQECGGTNLTTAGALAATAVVLSENDFSPYVCGDAGAAQSGRAVVLGVATSEYAAESTKSPTMALLPGTFTIGNENVPDPDFCMFPPGTDAFLQLLDIDDGGVWNGVSGTVTVTAIASDGISGSFTTQLANADGTNADAGTLTGTFTAPGCP